MLAEPYHPGIWESRRLRLLASSFARCLLLFCPIDERLNESGFQNMHNLILRLM